MITNNTIDADDVPTNPMLTNMTTAFFLFVCSNDVTYITVDIVIHIMPMMMTMMMMMMMIMVMNTTVDHRAMRSIC